MSSSSSRDSGSTLQCPPRSSRTARRRAGWRCGRRWRARSTRRSVAPPVPTPRGGLSKPPAPSGRITSSFQSRNLSRSSSGSPSSCRKTVHGSGTANSSWKSHSPRSAKPVDHLVHQLGDGRFARGHLARREQRVEDAAVLRVLGRVDLQRDQRPHVAEVDGIHVRREHVGALERHLDVGETAEHHRSCGRPEHRGRLAQRLVHRLGFRETRHRLVDIAFGVCHSDSLAPTSGPIAVLHHIA